MKKFSVYCVRCKVKNCPWERVGTGPLAAMRKHRDLVHPRVTIDWMDKLFDYWEDVPEDESEEPLTNASAPAPTLTTTAVSLCVTHTNGQVLFYNVDVSGKKGGWRLDTIDRMLVVPGGESGVQGERTVIPLDNVLSFFVQITKGPSSGVVEDPVRSAAVNSTDGTW